MVTFNCDDCGSTLRKKAILQHRCPRRTFVCIDCQVCMPLAQAQKHTECITEGEKYMGSDYKGTRKLDFNNATADGDNKRQKVNLSHLGISDSDDEKPAPKKTTPAAVVPTPQPTKPAQAHVSSDDEKPQPTPAKADKKSDKKNKKLANDQELVQLAPPAQPNNDQKQEQSDQTSSALRVIQKQLKKQASTASLADLFEAVHKKDESITQEVFGTALVKHGSNFHLSSISK